MVVSIITVSFNSSTTIEDTILSVLSQSYSQIQYIVIDGSSSDNTLHIINKYKDKIDLIISEKDNGIYDAMNKGIRESTGDIIGILNSDDLFEDNYVISEVVQNSNQIISLVLLLEMLFMLTEIIQMRLQGIILRKAFKSFKLRFGWMPPHAATFIKSDVYKNIGLYSNDYQISSDYEFFVRMLYVHKLKFSRLNKVLVRMRNGGISTASLKSIIKLNSEIVSACNKNGMYTNIFILLFKFPFKFLEFYKRP